MSKKKNQFTRREALRLMGAAGATVLAVGGNNSALKFWQVPNASVAAEALSALLAGILTAYFV